MLYQARQQNQCAGNSRAIGAPGCAMVVRDSGHVCDTKHPVCKHRRDRRQPNKRAEETAAKSDVDGAQLLAWMTEANQ